MSIFVVAVIWRTYQQSSITKLGELINDNLLILLLVLLLISFGLMLLTITETITNFISVRRYELETLIAIGWNRREIWLLNAKEILIWSIPAMFIGLVVGTVIALFYFSFSWRLLWLGVGTFTIFVFITILYTAWMISQELKRLYK
ncbi:FtsX-like permease family protein [Amphibacillus sediminis]|uniref:FtsX-like permease family protein n=1 Tax=Amphibacillus sediminis TaxID=360185 RepID=UPI00082EF580|nr:FtsX-like permease family protein [Amphibacillus sediminis]